MTMVVIAKSLMWTYDRTYHLFRKRVCGHDLVVSFGFMKEFALIHGESSVMDLFLIVEGTAALGFGEFEVIWTYGKGLGLN